MLAPLIPVAYATISAAITEPALSDPLNTALQTIIDTLPCFDQTDYAQWLADTALNQGDHAAIAEQLAHTSDLPTISILIAGQHHEEGLSVTLRSLRDQIHQGFDVVVGCVDSQVASLSKLQREFSELSVSLIATTDGSADIPSLESAALCAATGNYVAFLARGDRLPPESIAEIVLALRRRPESLVVYTDEDWIDSTGERSRPRLKSDWDPDAQLGFDLMGRFSPMRRDIALEVGGLSPDLGLAAHYDLHCRVAERVGPGGILHLPAVLRHAAKQAFASATAADAYASLARHVAAESVWRAEGIAVEVSPAPLAPWLNRVHWPDPRPLPLVSILLPTRDRADLVSAAARGILEMTDYPEIELLILDNNSVEPETADLFKSLSADPRVQILPTPGPFNYSRINNVGARTARGEILLLLNNDVEIIDRDWLREMVSLAVREEVGCVGAKLLYADSRIQHAGVTMAPYTGCAHVGRLQARDYIGDSGSLAITTTRSAVTAACLAVRRTVFEEVGGLDETHLQVGYNDVDLCLKVGDAGYRSVMTPFAVLFHLESVSRGPNDNPVKRQREKLEQGRAVSRWREVFLDDPCQNPNVHLAWDGMPRLARSRRRREWENLLNTHAA